MRKVDFLPSRACKPSLLTQGLSHLLKQRRFPLNGELLLKRAGKHMVNRTQMEMLQLQKWMTMASHKQRGVRVRAVRFEVRGASVADGAVKGDTEGEIVASGVAEEIVAVSFSYSLSSSRYIDFMGFFLDRVPWWTRGQ